MTTKTLYLPLERSTIEKRQQPHWVYRMYDAEGVLLYIGLTRNPRQRMQTWRRAWSPDRWVGQIRSVRWMEYPDWKAGALAERAAIQTEDPLHNRGWHERCARPWKVSVLDMPDEEIQAIRDEAGRRWVS